MVVWLAALRATQFYLGVPVVTGGVDTWTVAYTVPAGKRAILKNVLVANESAASKVTAVRIDGTLRVYTLTVANGASASTDLYLVLNAGQTIGVLQRNAGVVTYGLSGYLLFV